MGVLEAALYAVPVSFVVSLLLSGYGTLPTLVVAVVVWAAAWVWVMRRAEAKFRRTRDSPAAGNLDRLQVTVLGYTATASVILLAFVALPPLVPGGCIGALLPPEGLLYFCCVILLCVSALFSLLGLVPAVRRSVYPEYPGLTATFVFALGMAALFFSAITGL